MGTKDDYESKNFKNQMGISATVERRDVAGEEVATARTILRSAGEALKPTKGIEYVGSAAVHVYLSRILGQVFYVSQCAPLGTCPKDVANYAIRDLENAIKDHYGVKRTRLRSGL